MSLLYAVHDRDGHPIVPGGGWCVDAVLVSDAPTNYSSIRADLGWIVRLNHGWHPNGTVPLPGQYDEFAKRCANYVLGSKGADWFIIGNEPNHAQEWPQGNKITPEQYADCFNRCYQAIKQVRPEVKLLPAAVAPWNTQSGMDWWMYYRVMLEAIDRCDGFAVHGYTHGADPSLIFNYDQVQGWYWHFPVIYQTLTAIPDRFDHLPIHITETDQGDNAWVDSNSGWVQNAYRAIDDYNRVGGNGTQPILSLALYRWRGDKWELYNKPRVQDDFRAAVAKGYQSPAIAPTPTPPDPTPDPAPTREIDPDLIRRGVKFDFASPPPGTGYWRIKAAVWLDEAEADAVGPDHHILGEITRGDARVGGVPFLVEWPSGSAPIASKDGGNAGYNYDFPMSSSLNEFSIRVNDAGTPGVPSDKASGIGMGKDGNPSIHTSTWIDWEWAIGEGEQPPKPTPTPPIAGTLVHPLPGAVITQHFYQNPKNYAQFGLPGHNGTDLGGKPVGTPIACIADGTVVFSDFDADYGNYVRVQHDGLGVYSFYAHLRDPGAPVGKVLRAGDVVGLLGSTGNSTGPHLHLEIRLHDANGNYREGTPMAKGRIDPQTWCCLHGLTL